MEPSRIDAIQIGQYATTVSAINQLKQGVDKMRAYEEFASAYLAGDYNKPIQALETKIEECRKKRADVIVAGNNWRAQLAHQLSLVGRWVAPSGQTLIFRPDNTVLYNWYPGNTGSWSLEGNTFKCAFPGKPPQVPNGTLSGNSILYPAHSYTRR
jgi:hypothetical protein